MAHFSDRKSSTFVRKIGTILSGKRSICSGLPVNIFGLFFFSGALMDFSQQRVPIHKGGLVFHQPLKQCDCSVDIAGLMFIVCQGVAIFCALKRGASLPLTFD